MLRFVAFVFSTLSFVIMATNNHTLDVVDDYIKVKFNDCIEYMYCFSIVFIASIYLVLQLGKAIYEIINGSAYTSLIFFYMDFICDNISPYLLMPSVSATVVLVCTWTDNNIK